jgi:hypothetical protein
LGSSLCGFVSRVREFYGLVGCMRRYKDDVLNPKRKDTTTENLPRNM